MALATGTLAGALVASFAGPLVAQQEVRVRTGVADSVRVRRLDGRDTVLLRVPLVFRDSASVHVLTTGSTDDVMSLINQLNLREARLIRELAETPPRDVAARRAVEEELASVSREAFTMMSLLESRCLAERRSGPPGYLGLIVTHDVTVNDRAVVTRRATVSSVEPGSPAWRAGVRANDRLVAIGGRDARESVPELSDLLIPGGRVAVRVERDGALQDMTVLVAPRPRGFNEGCPQIERAIQPLRMGAVARVWVHDTTDAQGNRRVIVMSPQEGSRWTPGAPAATAAGTPGTPPTAVAPATVPATPSVPSRPAVTTRPSVRVSGTGPTPPTPSTPPVPEAAPAAPSMFVFGSTSGTQLAYFAGAQFRALDDDWRAVLGLRPGTEGVLVNEVAPGSAAAQSGLKVGDVVTMVGDAAATSPLVVSRLLGLSEEQRATLRVVRARATRTVTLQWTPTPR